MDNPSTELTHVRLEHMKVLNLMPGDVIVLRAPMLMPHAGRIKLLNLLQNKFPDNSVLILDAGVELFVVGKGL